MTSLFAGSEDANLLQILHRLVQNPSNDAQRVFRLTWDAVEMVHQETDGLETLFEHSPSLEDYALAFGEIGMPEVTLILHRVLQLIPPELRTAENNQALLKHLSVRHNELTDLTFEFCEACLAFVPFAARYVREHQNDFCDLVESDAS